MNKSYYIDHVINDLLAYYVTMTTLSYRQSWNIFVCVLTCNNGSKMVIVIRF